MAALSGQVEWLQIVLVYTEALIGVAFLANTRLFLLLPATIFIKCGLNEQHIEEVQALIRLKKDGSEHFSNNYRYGNY